MTRTSGKVMLLWVCALVMGWASTAHGQFTVLHRFKGYPTDGANPLYGPLVLDGDYLYGTTERGGSILTGSAFFAKGMGTAFRIKTDGTGYELLHDFQGGPGDGAYPKGQLTLYGESLYGMTNRGGSDGAGGTAVGTIFSMNRDGGGFAVLHSFNSGSADGSLPYTGLAAGQLGDTDYLYGMTRGGGTHGKGAVFRIGTDGADYTHLHDFNGGNHPGDDLDDGREPWGSVTLHDGKLYGMTRHGGDDDNGTLFRLNTDGSGFQMLHEFGAPPDGQQPFGRPIIHDGRLYGMCIAGGNINPAWGVVYRSNLDGTDHEIIHHFAGDPDGGRQPHGHLVALDGLLYGMSFAGGEFGSGDVFTIDPTTGDYANVHSFTAWDSPDGADPYGSLVTDGRYLYGMTYDGGDNDGVNDDGIGVVFRIDTIPEPASLALLGLGGLGLLHRRRKA